MTLTIHLEDMAATLASIEEKLHTLQSLPQDILYKANFVCEEILTNLARHANFEGREEKVTLLLDASRKEELILLFQDNSKAFNMLTFPDPKMSLDIDEREIGGLGIFLTKKYAKSLEYHYKDNTNLLKVVL